MRLSTIERRSLENILKFRLAPIFRSVFVRKPLMVLITATVWLSPAAIAKINDGTAVFAFEPISATETTQDNVKIYNAKELKSDPIVPVVDIGDRLSEQVIGVLRGVGESPASQNNIRKHQTQNTKSDYFVKQATLLENTSSKSDPEAVRKEMQQEARSVATKQALEQTPLYKRMKSGFDFNLDFSRLFTSDKGQKPVKKATKVRYGLVLKSVNAHKDLSKAQAAINSDLPTDMTYLGEADVEWTIGPITENTDRKVFNANIDPLGQEGSLTEDQAPLVERVDKAETDADFWANGGIPSPVFKSNVKPASDKSIQDALSSQKKLALKISLTQEQGLYQIDVATPTKESPKTTKEQQLKLPIIGTFSVGRRYGDKMEVVSTSANNILIKKELPKLSVHYFEQKQQYVADGTIGETADPVQITFKMRTDAQKVTDKEKTKREYQKGYEVGVKKSF